MRVPGNGFYSGCRDALPVVLGYLPIAVAYGILARQAGIPPHMTVFMSVMVFAGSSQFIGVSMIAGGASWGIIVMTTFLVNLRHLLMSASLSPYFKKFSRRWLPLLAFGLTDETFAVAGTVFRQDSRDEKYVFGLQLTAYLSWVGGSLAGALVGGSFTAAASLGLEFVLYAMFISLLVAQITDRRMLFAALFSGGAAMLGARFLPGHWYIILATLLGATLGVVMEDGRKLFAPLSGDGPGDLSS